MCPTRLSENTSDGKSKFEDTIPGKRGKRFIPHPAPKSAQITVVSEKSTNEKTRTSQKTFRLEFSLENSWLRVRRETDVLTEDAVTALTGLVQGLTNAGLRGPACYRCTRRSRALAISFHGIIQCPAAGHYLGGAVYIVGPWPPNILRTSRAGKW